MLSVAVRALLKFALTRPPAQGRVWPSPKLKVFRSVVIRAPPSSWLVDWLLALL
jgi:hypothetical protein